MKQVTLCVIFLSSVEKYHAHIVEVEILSLFVKIGLDFHMHDWYIFYTKYLQHVNLFISLSAFWRKFYSGRKSFYFNPPFFSFLRFDTSLFHLERLIFKVISNNCKNKMICWWEKLLMIRNNFIIRKTNKYSWVQC